jgi:hypothetical protein
MIAEQNKIAAIGPNSKRIFMLIESSACNTAAGRATPLPAASLSEAICSGLIHSSSSRIASHKPTSHYKYSLGEYKDWLFKVSLWTK